MNNSSALVVGLYMEYSCGLLKSLTILQNEQAPPLDQQFPWEYLDDQFSSVNEQRPTNI